MTGYASAGEWDIRGELAGQAFYFPHPPLYPLQSRQNGSISFKSEFFRSLTENTRFTFTPFYRWDAADPERTHGDIRQLDLLWVAESFELTAGISKVFWGVTESQHLVDIVNQTDAVEALDGEEKLGQPMIKLSIPQNWGLVDLFVLPYFRERTFAGEEGRLRFGLPINTDRTVYDSSAEEQHVDWALRYIHSVEEWEVGLSYFSGTSRDPWFVPQFAGTEPALPPLFRRFTGILPIPSSPAEILSDPELASQVVLAPRYVQIRQAGVDLQYVLEQWLWKLEAIYREGQVNLQNQRQDYTAATAGFEYTRYGIAGTHMDLGLIAEALYDSRGRDAITPYEADVAFGFRWAWNDLRSTEILAFAIQDLDSPARVAVLESSTRLGERFKVAVEATVFSNQPASTSFIDLSNDDLLGEFRNDDYVQLELTYYF